MTIDLTTPHAPVASFLDGLARRLAVTLSELRFLAELASNAPLPFDLHDVPVDGAGLSGRLGQSHRSVEDAAYLEALSTLHDAAETLRRRGLVTDDGPDPGVIGAIGLLATPRLALDIDVAADGTQVKAWHRYADGAVATLSTCDGIVFELAWFPVDRWTAELARVTAVPGDLPLTMSAAPRVLDLPYSLVDSIGEALRQGRADLVPVLISQAAGDVRTDEGPLSHAELASAASALHTESRGRLRILAAEVSELSTTSVGVVSWIMLTDGWHSITPRHDQDGARVTVRRVDPGDLATELAPILAQVGS